AREHEAGFRVGRLVLERRRSAGVDPLALHAHPQIAVLATTQLPARAGELVADASLLEVAGFPVPLVVAPLPVATDPDEAGASLDFSGVTGRCRSGRTEALDRRPRGREPDQAHHQPALDPHKSGTTDRTRLFAPRPTCKKPRQIRGMVRPCNSGRSSRSR